MRELRHGSAKMRPRARLIELIGDELISDEPVALVELVKNAYDADASLVTVCFEESSPEVFDRIVVQDDGIGMSLETVLDSWFEPGTISKRKLRRSPSGRQYLGAKGIGRFAAARLADTLVLESRARERDEIVSVSLNWGDFDEDSYLDEIQIDYSLREATDCESGTILTLQKLRKRSWEDQDFERLHSRLARLISPFEEVSDFEIALDIPGFPQYSGKIEPPEVILQPRYSLSGVLNEDGLFSGVIKFNEREHRCFVSEKIAAKGSRLSCGPFQVDIRAWDRDREGLEPISDRLGMGIREIRRTLNNFCGVSIYRDGFRVHPYGEQGNDWLNLDSRSRQYPVRSLANNQIIASIRISRDKNPELRDRSTREGMVYNEEHRSLELWFKRVLSLLEEARYGLRPRKAEEDRTEPLFESLDLSAVVNSARTELGIEHPVSQLLLTTEKEVRAGVERIQEVFSRLLMSAGLGQMVDMVIHEIGSPLGKINRQVAFIENKMSELCQPQTREFLKPRIDDIKGWLELIHNLRSRLEPQTPAKRGRASSFWVREEIEDNFELYGALLEKQKVFWEVGGASEPIRVHMSRASFGQILANLIDNSIYWLIDEKGPGNGGQIRVRLEPLPSGFRIVFSDDGPGIRPEDESQVFEPYFSTKRGGSGMGLGLYICRLIIEPYGRITLGDEPSCLPGACFDLRFERKVGR